MGGRIEYSGDDEPIQIVQRTASWFAAQGIELRESRRQAISTDMDRGQVQDMIAKQAAESRAELREAVAKADANLKVALTESDVKFAKVEAEIRSGFDILRNEVSASRADSRTNRAIMVGGFFSVTAIILGVLYALVTSSLSAFSAGVRQPEIIRSEAARAIEAERATSTPGTAAPAPKP